MSTQRDTPVHRPWPGLIEAYRDRLAVGPDWVPVTLREAALGATVEVPLLDGGTSKIKIKPGTSSGTVMRLRGKGATTRKKTGDLLVTIQVAVPKKLSKAAKEALEA